MGYSNAEAEAQKQAACEASESERAKQQAVPALAAFKLLYESSDKRMCLFEDAQGHLIAAPSQYLA